jgi:hypothetical protein
MGAREFFARYRKLCERAKEQADRDRSEQFFSDMRKRRKW